MKNNFINPESGLLRAGWRILGFAVLFLVLTPLTILGTRAVLGELRAGSNLQFTLLLISATLSVFLARKYLDKKSMSSLGLKWDRFALLDILFGIINSALVMAGMYFVLLWTNLIEFEGLAWWMDSPDFSAGFQLAALPIAFAVLYKFTIVAWWEELVFRGYLMQNLISGIGLMWTVTITSLVFGFIHSFNPDATFLSGVLIALITLQLIYAYLKTGQLWLPMGLHLGWNFFQSAVFGFASSGRESPSLIAQSPVGVDWLSGGGFGAEGSILIVPFTMLSLVIIHYGVRLTRQPKQKFFATVV